MLSYTDGRDYLGIDADRFSEWDFRLGGPSPSTRTLLTISPNGAVSRIAVGNYVWETRTLKSKSGMRQLETRRGRIDELQECREGEFLALVDFGRSLARVDARELAVDIATSGDRWTLETPDEMDPADRRITRWVDVRARSDIPEPENPSDLIFEKIDGRGSRKTVNTFLQGYEDGHVDHACGGVHHWKAAFVARYQDHIIGVIVLAPPQNGVLAAEGNEIVISRIACHPVRPPNTSSWLIARARDWAERAGYSRISALAGVDGNRGNCYQGAGFELEGETSEYVDPDGNVWHKRRYVDELEPEKYASRDVPMPGEAEKSV